MLPTQYVHCATRCSLRSTPGRATQLDGCVASLHHPAEHPGPHLGLKGLRVVALRCADSNCTTHWVAHRTTWLQPCAFHGFSSLVVPCVSGPLSDTLPCSACIYKAACAAGHGAARAKAFATHVPVLDEVIPDCIRDTLITFQEHVSTKLCTISDNVPGNLQAPGAGSADTSQSRVSVTYYYKSKRN
jgi:hypothetical protein